MPRQMSVAMLSAITAGYMQPAIFVQLSDNAGMVYLWTGIGSISWNGQTWSGIGDILSLTVAEEGTDVQARGMAVTLNAFDSTILSDIMSDYQLGLPAIVYFACFSGGSIIADPLIAWLGRMDQPAIDVDADKSTVQIALESRLLDMNVATDRRYTNQDQQMTWPGDLGMLFVDAIQELTIFWGGFPQAGTNV